MSGSARPDGFSSEISEAEEPYGDGSYEATARIVPSPPATMTTSSVTRSSAFRMTFSVWEKTGLSWLPLWTKVKRARPGLKKPTKMFPAGW